MKTDILVSVIIPVYNYGRYLGEAIGSVLSQTYRPLEIIVVDDGSDDDSAAVARSFPQVRYIRRANGGVAAARNTGLAAAQGGVIAFLDADDIWSPRKLEKQVGYLRRHPATGFTITKIENRIEPGVFYPSHVMRHILHDDQIGLATIVARREVFEQVGGFDTRFKVTEDFEWFTRAKDAGISMMILPEKLLIRRVHAKNISLTQFAASASARLKILRESIDRQQKKSDMK